MLLLDYFYKQIKALKGTIKHSHAPDRAGSGEIDHGPRTAITDVGRQPDML